MTPELVNSSPRDLDDEINLLLLRSLVSGRAVSVNIGVLARKLRRHRNTVRKEVLRLLEHNVVNKPICPFVGLYREYPLLVVVRADLPDQKHVRDWVAQDKHIFAAYRSRRDRYNMLLFLYHKDVMTYQLWRESLTDEGKIPPREARFPSYSLYFSNQLMLKYNPSAAIDLMETELEQNGWLQVNGLVLDELGFQVLKHLTSGGVFKLNETFLSKELGINRRTVANRINLLQRKGWILEPVCRFPDLLCPPSYILAYSILEILKARDEIFSALRSDPHVSMALRISSGGYNLLLFSAHPDISEHMEWEETLSKRFRRCIGHADITYLSPRAKITIDQQLVSLCLIEDKLKYVRRKDWKKTVS